MLVFDSHVGAHARARASAKPRATSSGEKGSEERGQEGRERVALDIAGLGMSEFEPGWIEQARSAQWHILLVQKREGEREGR